MVVGNIVSSLESSVLRFIPVRFARKILVHTSDAQAVPLFQEKKQLLIDVSVIVDHDARTGIQRVVRALLHQILTSPPEGFVVRPIFASRKHGYKHVESLSFLDIPSNGFNHINDEDVIQVNAGDIFLGLDLTAHILPRYKQQLAGWKRKGVKIHIVVYDLLPLLHPEWFNKATTRNFHRWIRSLALLTDVAICISKSVKLELEGYLSETFGLAMNDISIHRIPLGMDIEASLPSTGITFVAENLFNELSKREVVLMVGTIEPRKGYLQTLQAFERLWELGSQVNLVIIGKQGWKTENLQRKIRSHPQKNIKLWWIEDASDEFVERLYLLAKGVIVASEGEGFGLPLMEAMRHERPVLVRDINVFREVAGDFVTYFESDSQGAFSQTIANWLHDIEEGNMTVECIPLVSWKDSAEELYSRIGIE